MKNLRDKLYFRISANLAGSYPLVIQQTRGFIHSLSHLHCASCALIEYSKPTEAQLAVRRMDRKWIEGIELRCYVTKRE